MKKRVYGRKFSRDTGSRRALFRSLLTAFVRSGQIETTLPRAKAIKPLIDKLVSKAKKGMLSSHRQLQAELAQNEGVVRKLEEEVNARFTNLTSGFTRMVRVERRRGDNAEMARLVWSRGKVEDKSRKKVEEKVESGSKSKKMKNKK